MHLPQSISEGTYQEGLADPPPKGTALARAQDAPPSFDLPPAPRETARTDIVWAALAKAQAKFEPVRKGRTADAGTKGTYTYANLDDMMKATRPALQAEGLTISWRMCGARMFVRLMHADSAQWIESDMDIVPADARKGVQALGAALTYCRRYLLSMLLGVVPEDVDTDAEGEIPLDLVRFILSLPVGDAKARAELIESMAAKRESASVRKSALALFDERSQPRGA